MLYAVIILFSLMFMFVVILALLLIIRSARQRPPLPYNPARPGGYGVRHGSSGDHDHGSPSWEPSSYDGGSSSSSDSGSSSSSSSD